MFSTDFGASNDDKGDAHESENGDSGDDFVTGVIEGFYHRPWTRSQRLSLFKRLARYKLNSYLYAPKDDAKHRSLWRELYTDDECLLLKELIDSCKENQITFYYGISPGLDMSYSESEEMDLLKQKTSQLITLGCEGFAILWDDIQPELSKKDAEHFKSFSEAHCTVSNALFDHLDKPKFLFCPVEYCASRSMPSVLKSEYLITIGNMLHKYIKVFWTGSKVVSQTITAKECQELASVIKRKPLIWDNLHANDYDIQRCYLGPYLGRETEPRTYLSGAMTNPNCEFSLNIPAIASLAEWASNSKWDSSHEKILKELLEEFEEGPHARIARTAPAKEEDGPLTLSDVELLCQMFWLPHSHGPKIEQMLVDIRYCIDNARAMLGWKDLDPGSQPDYIDDWLDRATNVNDICKQFFLVCDKMTHIPNREIMFDLNPYLNNVRVTLHACNNYLKWVGLQDCVKPIKGFPCLAGLVGGLAGDLARLYPVQDVSLFPLKTPITPSSNSLMILPHKMNSKKRKKDLEEIFDREFKEFSDLIELSTLNLIMKKKKFTEVSTVGLFSCWDLSKPDEKVKKSKLGSKFLDIFKSDKVKSKYSCLLKIFLTSGPLILDPQVLESLLDSLQESDRKGVVVSVGEEQTFLSRFLLQNGFKELKTDKLLAGQDLLCKVL